MDDVIFPFAALHIFFILLNLAGLPYFGDRLYRDI
ncbi:hypothetical protein C1752_00933 [Acaryochloris thomasi RCC1774]|uniref:Uncharacterized protein n=1 Tax=Acaryochloris thomasi RCC1774 TaxID=1764569 RepID=A0A2W1JNR7_9CYAN|nr:hypothetical protein C1752_00933 [Acaryochloris thomasi RCC1774]